VQGLKTPVTLQLAVPFGETAENPRRGEASTPRVSALTWVAAVITAPAMRNRVGRARGQPTIRRANTSITSIIKATETRPHQV